MKFTKGLKDQITEPVIVKQGDQEIDRFNVDFKYMTFEDRERIKLLFITEITHKQEVVEQLAKDKEAATKKGEELDITDAMILNLWQPINKKVEDLLIEFVVSVEDREWNEKTQAEVFAAPEYRDAICATLRRLSRGEYHQARDEKNLPKSDTPSQEEKDSTKKGSQPRT